MDRIKVPTNHCYKKSFYVSLQEAFFAWNPESLLQVKNKKKQKHNLTDEEIDADMYFKVRWWQERVFRKILPPSMLYWRVRAVLAFYGNKVDKDTSKPLFNERAWKKASKILIEITNGNVSDPPNLQLYVHRLNKKERKKSTRMASTCAIA